MGLLTIVFTIILGLSVYFLYRIMNGNISNPTVFKEELKYIKSIGLFALILGILGQLIGLFGAFEAIQRIGNVSPALLAGGLKVSSICNIYGMIIFLISMLLWITADYVFVKRIPIAE